MRYSYQVNAQNLLYPERGIRLVGFFDLQSLRSHYGKPVSDLIVGTEEFQRLVIERNHVRITITKVEVDYYNPKYFIVRNRKHAHQP